MWFCRAHAHTETLHRLKAHFQVDLDAHSHGQGRTRRIFISHRGKTKTPSAPPPRLPDLSATRYPDVASAAYDATVGAGQPKEDPWEDACGHHDASGLLAVRAQSATADDDTDADLQWCVRQCVLMGCGTLVAKGRGRSDVKEVWFIVVTRSATVWLKRGVAKGRGWTSSGTWR